MTLDGLCRMVAARIAGGVMAAWMIVLVWGRVKRIERRVLGLLARFRAGRLWVRVAVVRSGGGEGRCRAGVQRLPRRFGWLVAMVPSEAASLAGQVRAVLAEPEMVGLLAASAQARRVLGPLCRMLGIEAEILGGGGPVADAVAVGIGPGDRGVWAVAEADPIVAPRVEDLRVWRGSG